MTSIRTGLIQGQDQRMALSPAFLQALEILQMGAADLVREVETECARNETLRLVHRGPRAEGDSDRRHQLLEQLADRPTDLLEHIRREVGMLDLDDDLAERVLALAGLLDERGYLAETEAQLEARIGGKSATEALGVLHAIPPLGLGARGPIEAMLLQIPTGDPDRPALESILRDGLADLARGRRAEVVARLGLDPTELDGLLLRIRRLDPQPASRFRRGPPTPLQPDLVLRTHEGRSVVELADGSSPAIAVDRSVARLAKGDAIPIATRRLVATNLRRARRLIRAVENRGETLLRIAKAVFDAQRDFFRRGMPAVRKLRMQDLAVALGLHSSTVSRAVAGKTVWTEFGMIPLRSFFEVSGGGPSHAEREELVAAIRASLQADHALTDTRIAERLAERGLVVARRTIAKYRALLGVTRRARAERDADPGT